MGRIMGLRHSHCTDSDGEASAQARRLDQLPHRSQAREHAGVRTRDEPQVLVDCCGGTGTGPAAVAEAVGQPSAPSGTGPALAQGGMYTRTVPVHLPHNTGYVLDTALVHKWVSAAGCDGYRGSPAAESSHAVQAQRTALSQNPEGEVQSF